MKKQTTYYLHTIDGRPAFFDRGEQICFINSYGPSVPDLVPSLRQIRAEQKASAAWREENFCGNENNGYDYVRVRFP